MRTWLFTRVRLCGLAVLMLAGVPGALPARAETITLRADAWCPYNCAPGSARPGYVVEIAREVFAARGIEVDYALMPWARALESVRQGKISGVIGATRQEGEDLVFGEEAVGFSSDALAARRGYGFTYRGAESLDGHRLAAVRDYSYEPEIDAYIAAHAEAGEAVSLASGEDVTVQNLRKLLANRVDLVLEDRNVLDYTLAAEGLTGLAESQAISAPEVIHIAFPPADPKAADHAAVLDAGLREMRRSGRLAEILSRYGLTDWTVGHAAAVAPPPGR